MVLRNRVTLALVILGMVSVASGIASSADPDSKARPDDESPLLDLLRVASPVKRSRALVAIEADFHPWYFPALLEVLRLNQDPVFERRLFELMRKESGEDFGTNFDRWFGWIWSQQVELPEAYSAFKRSMYRLVDPRFEKYFEPGGPSLIRLDEVRWGGVVQNGIPPLRNPIMIRAEETDDIAASDVVFGVFINGDARAYPKRILAWHELATDEIGGLPVAIVYCTLCGTVIVYETRVEGKHYDLGTSGFLYRSNKLMFDRKTNSLWSTLEGRPVIGPLAGGQNKIVLPRRPVVTTTFAEWRRRHPKTQVLSLRTGFSRDYSEGAAYRDYFASPGLMFGVPKLDSRLAKKDEVLGLRSADPTTAPVAISVAYLRRTPLLLHRSNAETFVILTDRSGASRVYLGPSGVDFVEWDQGDRLVDQRGVVWRLEEERLESSDGRSAVRYPAHRAFWFGWYAAFPETVLIGAETGEE